MNGRDPLALCRCTQVSRSLARPAAALAPGRVGDLELRPIAVPHKAVTLASNEVLTTTPMPARRLNALKKFQFAALPPGNAVHATHRSRDRSRCGIGT